MYKRVKFIPLHSGSTTNEDIINKVLESIPYDDIIDIKFTRYYAVIYYKAEKIGSMVIN